MVTPGSTVNLLRWTGAAWVDLGGSDALGGLSGFGASTAGLSLAFDGGGNPIVAWQHMPTGFFTAQVYLRRWNPSSGAWEELGGSGSGNGISNDPGTLIGGRPG